MYVLQIYQNDSSDNGSNEIAIASTTSTDSLYYYSIIYFIHTFSFFFVFFLFVVYSVFIYCYTISCRRRTAPAALVQNSYMYIQSEHTHTENRLCIQIRCIYNSYMPTISICWHSYVSRHRAMHSHFGVIVHACDPPAAQME